MSQGPERGTGVNQCGQNRMAQPMLRLVGWQVCLWVSDQEEASFL